MSETISEARQRALEAIAALDDTAIERITTSAKKEKAMRDAEAAGLVIAPETPIQVTLDPSYEQPSPNPTKLGIKSTEFWLALLMPLVVGAVVQLGWLTEESATELGMATGASYVLGRSLVRSIVEWRKR